MEAVRYFFVHIMRSGGASLSHQLEALYSPGQVYPDRRQDHDEFTANIDIEYLKGLSPERMDAIRVFTGHFPFFVTQQMPSKVRTLSIVRDPVARTISLLQTKQRGARTVLPLQPPDAEPDPYMGRELEALYEDPNLRATMLDNFQTRQFGLCAEDGVRTGVDPVAVDATRLARAKEHLAQLDVLGLHDRYPEVMATAKRRFGWAIDADATWHVSEPVQVPESFRARIAADNPYDNELYEFAVEEYERRQHA